MPLHIIQPNIFIFEFSYKFLAEYSKGSIFDSPKWWSIIIDTIKLININITIKSTKFIILPPLYYWNLSHTVNIIFIIIKHIIIIPNIYQYVSFIYICDTSKIIKIKYVKINKIIMIDKINNNNKLMSLTSCYIIPYHVLIVKNFFSYFVNICYYVITQHIQIHFI